MGRDLEGFNETPHLAYKLNNDNSAVAEKISNDIGLFVDL